MNNNSIHNPKNPIQLSIDCNPLTSKAMMGIIGLMSPQEVTSLCIQELIKGTRINETDLPFYAAACEVFKKVIINMFSENDKELYERVLKDANIIAVNAEELRKQMSKGKDTALNKNNTESTQDSSMDKHTDEEEDDV